MLPVLILKGSVLIYNNRGWGKNEVLIIVGVHQDVLGNKKKAIRKLEEKLDFRLLLFCQPFIVNLHIMVCCVFQRKMV